MLHLLRRTKYLYKLFSILLSKRFVSFPPLTNLFNHLFVSVCTHGYLLYTLSYNTVLLYLLLKLFQLWPLGALSVGSCVPLTYLSQCEGQFFLLDVPNSSCMFSVPVLESSICVRSPDIFYLANDSRNQAQGGSCACSYWVSFLLGPFSRQSKEIYVCIRTSVNIHIYKHFYM